MNSEQLQKAVSESLDNADSNGHIFENWTFREVAEDLVTHDADLEIYPVERIIPCVREWHKNSDLIYRILD